jgi:nucleoside-diphosphate-sugar epimerase
MVRAFVFLAGLPMLPFRPTDKIDIVNVDFVAGAVADLHQKANPLHTIYHLSSGTAAETFVQLTDSLAKASGKRGPMFVPKFEKSTSKMVDALAGKAGKLGGLATLLKVFLPYLVWNTVFDNTRATTELGRKPVPFSEYSFGLLKFSRGNHFVYKYRDWPTDAAAAVSARQAGAGQDLGR